MAPEWLFVAILLAVVMGSLAVLVWLEWHPFREETAIGDRIGYLMTRRDQMASRAEADRRDTDAQEAVLRGKA